jgi:hypothetical protein
MELADIGRVLKAGKDYTEAKAAAAGVDTSAGGRARPKADQTTGSAPILEQENPLTVRGGRNTLANAPSQQTN